MKKSKKNEDSRTMASRKCFQNEALLFDVTVVLNIGASQEPVSELFVWKVIQTLFH